MTPDDDPMRDALDLAGVDLKVNSITGIRVIALMLAMKYQQGTVVQDAAMYDALRRDGVNIRQVQGIEHVLDIARDIEKHLFTEPKWLIEAAAEVEKEAGESPFTEPNPE